jgi:hypothetical protein
MAKPLRSPLLGYNHNVKYKGRIYHVQTEDSGPSNPRLFTHLYFEGTILASKRHEYDAASSEEVVRGLMQGQHKSILKDLKQSHLDEKLTSFFARRGEPFAVGETAEPSDHAAVPLAVVETISAPLDLDALPIAIVETPPPEVTHMALPTGGPGVYVMKKGGGDGLIPEHALATPTPVAGVPAGSPDGLLPVVVFDPMPSSSTPPPIPRGSPPPHPVPPRFPSTPRPSTSSSVVVQRQVVVGAGGSSVTPPPVARPQPPVRTRRPAPSIPYVVKEGSHTSASSSRPQSHQVPPARPMVPPPTTSANAPRTASVHASSAQPDVISDKSLDEVILAYLSQGDAKE